MAETKTLITPELRGQLDVWSKPRVSDPVDTSDIRRWAIAVYWPETPPRLFWDEAYARTTRWGGIIAPRDFNPFAWPVERPPEAAPRPAQAAVGKRGMNGGQGERYGVPMRAGDVITQRRALVKMEERVGKLGLTLYTYREERWTNQRGEAVRTKTAISLFY